MLIIEDNLKYFL